MQVLSSNPGTADRKGPGNGRNLAPRKAGASGFLPDLIDE